MKKQLILLLALVSTSGITLSSDGQERSASAPVESLNISKVSSASSKFNKETTNLIFQIFSNTSIEPTIVNRWSSPLKIGLTIGAASAMALFALPAIKTVDFRSDFKNSLKQLAHDFAPSCLATGTVIGLFASGMRYNQQKNTPTDSQYLEKTKELTDSNVAKVHQTGGCTGLKEENKKLANALKTITYLNKTNRVSDTDINDKIIAKLTDNLNYYTHVVRLNLKEVPETGTGTGTGTQGD